MSFASLSSLGRGTAAWISAVLLAFPAAATSPASLGELGSELERLLVDAQAQASVGELHLAESLSREARRAVLELSARLAASRGESAAAQDLFLRAEALAEPDPELRLWTAWTLYRAGESDEGLRRLRLLAHQFPADSTTRPFFLAALSRSGAAEELAAELEQGGGDAVPADGPLPTLDPGPLAALDASHVEVLEARLQATDAALARRIDDLVSAMGEAELRGITGAVSEPGSEAEPFGPWDELDLGAEGHGIRKARVDVLVLAPATPPSLRQALEAIDAGDTARAEAELAPRLDEDAALTLWAMAALAEGRRDEAAARFERAVAEQERPLRARQTLARLAAEAGDTDALQAHLLQAAELGPLDRDLALYLAEREMKAGRMAAALRQLRDLDRRFESVEARLLSAEVFEHFNNPKRALDFLEQALIQAPHSIDLRRRHARAAFDGGVVSRAAASIEVLLRLAPDVAEFHTLRGRIRIAQGKMGEASESLLRALELDPDFEEAFLPLGLALNHESRFAEAATVLTRRLELRPDDLEAQAALAESEERLGQADEARRRVTAVLKADPDQARAHLVLGMLSFGDKDLASARASFERAVESDPKLAKAHYQLSLACARTGDRDCAREHLALYRKAQEGPEADFVPMQKMSDEPTLMEAAQAAGEGDG